MRIIEERSYITFDGKKFYSENEAVEYEELRLEVLRTMFEYEKWLKEVGAGSTYSTFCDDFGCVHSERSVIFTIISELRGHLTNELLKQL
jgi:hypothetical protein